MTCLALLTDEPFGILLSCSLIFIFLFLRRHSACGEMILHFQIFLIVLMSWEWVLCGGAGHVGNVFPSCVMTQLWCFYMINVVLQHLIIYFIYLPIWLHCILVAICRIFSCGMWDPSSLPRDWTQAPGLGAQSLSHRTTREIRDLFYLSQCLWGSSMLWHVSEF